MKLEDSFLESMGKLPGLDLDAFADAMAEPPVVSFKLNRRKALSAADVGFPDAEPVKWCSSGYYLAERPSFTLNPLLHAGAFYVQDASSMIYETILEHILASIGAEAPLSLLDLCAAPGGKTTSMINALPDGSIVVANELMPLRAQVLKENLLKWGYPHIMVTNSPTSRLAAVGECFDIVAVDAPCSGEGMMRKDPKAVEQWSPRLVSSCAALQREILADAVAILKPGGHLIYSTCTFNMSENEENLRYLVESLGLEPMDLALPAEWGIAPSFMPDLPAFRFMPHLTRGEGLFAALLVKPGQASATSFERLRKDLRKRASVILDGIPRTIAKGKVEIPASEQVLATDYRRGEYPEAELSLNDALRYLRHEALSLPSDLPKGYLAVTYQGYPLGLVKNLGSRANNLYPSAWRIRKDV